MKAAYLIRYWAELTVRRTDDMTARGEASFGRRYLAALLGAPMIAPLAKPQVEPSRTNQRSFFGPLLAAVSIIVVVTLAVWAFAPGPPVLPTYAVEPVEVQGTRIVVLLDESASMSPEDLAREHTAAALIVHSQLSPNSAVSILGFSDKVDTLCQTTALTGPERSAIANCIKGLNNRRAEGGTDHAMAMTAALEHLGGKGSNSDQRLVFLLTDGKLEVSANPSYGENPERRNAAAQGALTTATAKARDEGVQIWPIGFGEADADALARLAAEGYQGSCEGQHPKATVLRSSDDLAGAVADAMAASQCVRIVSPRNEPGNEVEFSVRVPDGAKEAAIVVIKPDSVSTVRLLDPTGGEVPKSGVVGASTFQVIGERDPVEVIRVLQPTAGTWRVKIATTTSAQSAQVAVTWTT